MEWHPLGLRLPRVGRRRRHQLLVEEDPPTKFGVFPVVLGVNNAAACPSGYNILSNASLSSGGGLAWMSLLNDNFHTMGGWSSHSYGGSNANYMYTNGGGYGTNFICWKNFASTGGKPSATMRPLNFTACRGAEQTINVSDIGTGAGTGYYVRTGAGLVMANIYSWDYVDYIDGFARASFSASNIARFCLTVDNAQ